MITKEEFLKLAETEYEKIAALAEEKSFYEYEKRFEKIWIDMGRNVLEGSISDVKNKNRRKKKAK